MNIFKKVINEIKWTASPLSDPVFKEADPKSNQQQDDDRQLWEGGPCNSTQEKERP